MTCSTLGLCNIAHLTYINSWPKPLSWTFRAHPGIIPLCKLRFCSETLYQLPSFQDLVPNQDILKLARLSPLDGWADGEGSYLSLTNIENSTYRISIEEASSQSAVS